VPDRSAENPARVVIVGGGCAGMAAAWELAKQPNYDIHVYEKMPRLGGKGSSTRDVTGRILEHGLHVWMGWYENAFRMMRECYAIVDDKGWGPDSTIKRLAHRRFDDAFMPEPNVGLVDPKFHGQPVMWSVFFPPNEGQPGTPMQPEDNPFTMASYMGRLMEMAKALVLSVVGDMPGETPGPPRPDHRSRSDEILNLDMKTPPADSTAALLNRMAELSKAGALTGAAALLQLVTILEVWLRRQNIGPKAPESTLAIAEAGVSQARKLLRDLVGMDPRLRVKTEVVDIVLTIMIGLFSDRVMFSKDGLDALNDYDYREWLKLHGATKTSLESRFIRAAYDFAFAYEGGNLRRPRLAAGVALRGGFRMFFTYRGAAFWRMCSGMGDAIFAPLYAVLKDWQEEHDPDKKPAKPKKAVARKPPKYDPKLKSPVRFHFGYDLEEASFDNDGLSLKELKFALRPTIEPPLLQSNGGWPHGSGQAQEAVDEDDLKRTRRDNPKVRLTKQQFDFAIIATGIPEFKTVFVDLQVHKEEARPNAEVLKAWITTTELTKTVATKSAQVWLPTNLYDLGWRRGSGLFTCMGWETFDTYADMTHVLPAEGRDPKWRSLAYFCNPLRDKPDRRHEKKPIPTVEEDLEKLITEQMDAFWPKLFDKEKYGTPALRLEEWQRRVKAHEVEQHAQPNAVGSARYTLSAPGSIASRISPLDQGIDNMTVAGDWTACGIDCGCVEAAVMSGMLAAAAISGKPKLDDIVGYDQP
jgi:uncharacterized protein with NAD-binding domain and iron-sulfur cluster